MHVQILMSAAEVSYVTNCAAIQMVAIPAFVSVATHLMQTGTPAMVRISHYNQYYLCLNAKRACLLGYKDMKKVGSYHKFINCDLCKGKCCSLLTYRVHVHSVQE